MAEQKTDAQRVSEAMVETERQAAERKADEIEPGGRYVVNGQAVNADGEPLKK